MISSVSSIIEELLTPGKCGVTGGTKSDIIVDYDLYLKLQVGPPPYTADIRSSVSPCILQSVAVPVSNAP